jgi:hypothetical protein
MCTYLNDIMEQLPFGTWVIVQKTNVTFCGFVCSKVDVKNHTISVFGKTPAGLSNNGILYEVSFVDAYKGKVSEDEACTVLAAEKSANVRPTWVLLMVSC